MSHPKLDAFRDLVQRYLAVTQLAWQERNRANAPSRLSLETQFLPAALELQQTPPHPAPRLAIWSIISLFIFVFLWAMIGKIDIVATAKGKITPNDRSKVIQPLETGTIKQIYVRDGQQVKKGDLLIELDATTSGADYAKTREAWQSASLDAMRAKLLLDALESNHVDQIPKLKGVEARDIAAQQLLLSSQFVEFKARLATVEAEISKRQAEFEGTREIVAKLEQTSPIAKERAEDYKNLLEKNFVSKHGYLDRQQQQIEQERDLASQRSHLRELQAAIEQNKKQRATMVAEFRRITLDAQSQAEQKAAELKQELIKNAQREKLLRLTAPVDGSVQQLAVHTVGGVVTPAQALLVIVPKDNPLEVEAWIENKDIGFVYPNQEAEIKVETFPYTKYGTIPAKVLSVANDAVNDEKKGLGYQARVLLQHSTIQVENKTVNLSPGMAVTVEIKTGQRRVIEYFLSPLLQYGHESLRER